FFFTEPFFAFEFSVRDIPTTVAFLFSALVISSWSDARKRAENRLRESESELRKARSELEAKVEERTAKLSRANEELQSGIIERSLDEAVRARSDVVIDFRIALADGSVKHVHGVGRPVDEESGEVDRYIGTPVDISARKRGEALFAGEKRLLEMIAPGIALKDILNALCLIIEEYRRGTLASVLLLRPDG